MPKPRMRLSVGAAAALAVAISTDILPARANFIEIVYTSLEGQPTETTESFPPSPVALDLSRDVPNVATAETIVDSRGIVRTIFQAAPAEDSLGHGFSIGPHSVRAIIDDTASFVGHGTVTYGFHIVGTGVLPNPPLNNPLLASYDKTLATLSWAGLGQQGAHEWFANQPLPTFTFELPGEPFGVDFTVQQTFSVNGTSAVPDVFPFTFELAADGVNGASLNLFDTAQAFAVLPAGVSVVTAGGFSAVGGVPSVPEPSTTLLLGAGLGLLAALRQVRSWGRKLLLRPPPSRAAAVNRDNCLTRSPICAAPTQAVCV